MSTVGPVKRIVEDFYLNFNGNNQLIIPSNFSFISDSSDWSISWFDVVDESVNTKHTVYSNYAGSGNGLEILVDLTGSNYVIELVRYVGGVPFINTITYRIKNSGSSITNFTLVYNSVLPNIMISLYANSVKVIDEVFSGVAFGSTGTNSYIGSNFDNTTNQRTGGLLKISFYNKKLIDQEIQYIYETAELPQSAFFNVQHYYPLNQVAVKGDGKNWFNDISNVYNPKPNGPVLTSTTGGFDYRGVLYDIPYNSGDKFSCILGEVNNNTAIGFTLTKTSGNVSNIFGIDYAVFTESSQGHRLFTTGASFGVQIKNPAVVGDVLEMERSGTDILVRINGVLLHTYTSVSTSPMYLHFLSTRLNGSGSKWRQLKRNGVPYGANKVFGSDSIVEHSGSIAAEAMGWTDDELGLNAGTSTFTAYGDYSTKTLGANFTESSGVVSYRGEEIRKKGLRFTGSEWFQVPTFAPSPEKGYTFLVGTSDVDGSGLRVVLGNTSQGGKFEIGNKTINGPRFGVEYNGGVYLGVANTSPTLFTSSNMTAWRYLENSFPDGYILDDGSGANKVQDVMFNNRRSFSIVNSSTRNCSQDLLNLTFDEYTTGIFIGDRFNGGGRRFVGVATYIACFKGVFTPDEVKYCYNNGLFNNPTTRLMDKYDLELFVDFQNPFNDNGTIKLPDLSPNNHNIELLNGYGGTVSGVEAALEDITGLF